MRYIGIDYGTKRVGIALSDEAGRFALPHSVIANSHRLFQGLSNKIEEIALTNGVKEIVMGESRDYTGKANKVLSSSLKLKGLLESKGYIVHLEPEFMTSVQAERFQGKSDQSDASAAALILQAYLDKENNKEGKAGR
jgi:putative Holliday junction resolvase